MAKQQDACASLQFIVAVITVALTSQCEAHMVADGGTMLIFLSGRDVDLRSTEADVISGPARVFAGPSFNNMSSCLCGSIDHETGWCYLGETVNGEKDAVNVSTVETGSQASLKCTLYVTVGKSYLFCNSRLVENGTSKVCRTLVACSSRTVAVMCHSERDCVAWCDTNSTAALMDQANTAAREEVQAPAKVTHHLGADVIGVIATGGVLCALFLICCIVNKIRRSKWWILRFPKKRKMSKAVSENFFPVSTIPLPSHHQNASFSASPDLTPSLVTRTGQSEQANQRKQSKKKLKVQFRSASLPTALDTHDSSVIIDHAHCQRSGSCGNTTMPSLGEKVIGSATTEAKGNSASRQLAHHADSIKL